MFGSVGDLFGWLLLAVGGALFAGTGAALLQHYRTGEFPRPADAPTPARDAGRAPAVVKCVIGFVLLVAGAVSLLS